MFETIVVGYDGSDPSVRALEAACWMVKGHKADLHVVHTPEPQLSEFADRNTISADAARAIKDATEIAETLGVTLASATVGTSQPFDDIMKVAKRHNAKLIITGRRGLGGVSGLLLGSTTQKLAQMANCAFMTVA